jgi:hypothetical protein
LGYLAAPLMRHVLKSIRMRSSTWLFESVQVFRRLFRLVLSRRDDLRIVTILRLELLGREVVQLAM